MIAYFKERMSYEYGQTLLHGFSNLKNIPFWWGCRGLKALFPSSGVLLVRILIEVRWDVFIFLLRRKVVASGVKFENIKEWN